MTTSSINHRRFGIRTTDCVLFVIWVCLVQCATVGWSNSSAVLARAQTAHGSGDHLAAAALAKELSIFADTQRSTNPASDNQDSMLRDQATVLFMDALLASGDVSQFKNYYRLLPPSTPNLDSLCYRWITTFRDAGRHEDICAILGSSIRNLPPESRFRRGLLSELCKAQTRTARYDEALGTAQLLSPSVEADRAARLSLLYFLGETAMQNERFSIASRVFGDFVSHGRASPLYGAAEFYWIKARVISGDETAVIDGLHLIESDPTRPNRDNLCILAIEHYAQLGRVHDARALCVVFRALFPDQVNTPEFLHANIVVESLADSHASLPLKHICREALRAMLREGITNSIETSHPRYLRYDCQRLWHLFAEQQDWDALNTEGPATVAAVLESDEQLGTAILGDYLLIISQSQENRVVIEDVCRTLVPLVTRPELRRRLGKIVRAACFNNAITCSDSTKSPQGR